MILLRKQEILQHLFELRRMCVLNLEDLHRYLRNYRKGNDFEGIKLYFYDQISFEREHIKWLDEKIKRIQTKF